MRYLPSVNSEDYKALLEMRVMGYSVLKQLFYVEPSSQILEALNESGVFDSFPFSEPENLISTGCCIIRNFFAEYMNDYAEMSRKVKWDFTQLFIGPYALPSPPWESVYRSSEHLLYQDTTFEARNAYLKYRFLPKNPSEADDHIGFEIDFMLKLSEYALDDYEKKNLQALNNVLNDSRDFLEKHLSQWISDFSADVQKNALTEFYRGAAILLKGFILEDLEIYRGE